MLSLLMAGPVKTCLFFVSFIYAQSVCFPPEMHVSFPPRELQQSLCWKGNMLASSQMHQI